MLLTIRHVTTYEYRRPVHLLPHRMMMRPRDTHNLVTRNSALQLSPAAELTWTSDVFGNLVADAVFAAPTLKLVVTNKLVVEQSDAAWPVLAIAPHAHAYPFDYAAADRLDLGPLLLAVDDPDGAVFAWTSGIVASVPTDTLSLLKDLNASASGFRYVQRCEEGTQKPGVTLKLGSGSCRDLAALFIAGARILGFGARAVTGYLLDDISSRDAEVLQHDATHAWAQVYLPGAGWVAFDPTNNRMGEAHLVPVAVGRDIEQLKAIEGRYVGAPEDCAGMRVEVSVSRRVDGSTDFNAVDFGRRLELMRAGEARAGKARDAHIHVAETFGERIPRGKDKSLARKDRP